MASVARPQTIIEPVRPYNVNTRMSGPFKADINGGTKIYNLRSTTRTKGKRKTCTAGSLENKRYKRSSEGAGLPGVAKEIDCASSHTIKATEAVSFTENQGFPSSNIGDDHQNKGSNPLNQLNTSRQVSARTLQAPSNEVRITDGSQAELADQQSSKTRQPKQETDITIAYPYIDEIVFFKDAFAFRNPTSVLVQEVWEKVSDSSRPCHIHIPKDSSALRKQMSNRAAEKTCELANKADEVILSLYGLEMEWESFNGSRQYNDQLQDPNGVQEAARKKFSNRVGYPLGDDKLLHPNHRSNRFGAPQIAEIIWKLWLSTDICRGHQIDNFIDQIDAPFVWLHCSLLYLALYQYYEGEFKKLPINRGLGNDIYTRQQASWKCLDDCEKKNILDGIRSKLRNRRSSGGSVDSDIKKSLKPRSTQSVFSKIQPSTDCAGLTSNEHLSQDRASPIEGSGGDMA